MPMAANRQRPWQRSGLLQAAAWRLPDRCTCGPDGRPGQQPASDYLLTFLKLTDLAVPTTFEFRLPPGQVLGAGWVRHGQSCSSRVIPQTGRCGILAAGHPAVTQSTESCSAWQGCTKPVKMTCMWRQRAPSALQGQRLLVVAFGSAPGLPNFGGLLRRIRNELQDPAHLEWDTLYVVDSCRNWYEGDSVFLGSAKLQMLLMLSHRCCLRIDTSKPNHCILQAVATGDLPLISSASKPLQGATSGCSCWGTAWGHLQPSCSAPWPPAFRSSPHRYVVLHCARAMLLFSPEKSVC